MLTTFIPENASAAVDRALTLGRSDPALTRELAEHLRNLMEHGSEVERLRDELDDIKEQLSDARADARAAGSEKERMERKIERTLNAACGFALWAGMGCPETSMLFIERERWDCGLCGHRHANYELGNICIGCPCPGES